MSWALENGEIRIDSNIIVLLEGARRALQPVLAKAARVAEIERLMNAEPGTEEGDRLDSLVTLVEEYEERIYPVGR